MRSLINLIVTTNTATAWAVVGGALSPPQTSSHPLLENPPPCAFSGFAPGMILKILTITHVDVFG